MKNKIFMKYITNNISLLCILSVNKRDEELVQNNFYIKKSGMKTFIVLFIFLLISNFTFSQKSDTSKLITSDSLSLEQIIKQVIENHPTIKEAEEALNISDAKIGLAKSGYLPNIDVAGSFTRIGPVPAVAFGGNNLNMAPANNVTTALEYNQTIYNFGKTAKDVNLANENKNLNQLSIEQLKQKMSVGAIRNFYTLSYIQDAIEIKDEELKTLNTHLDYVKKKNETGSATQYEILSTQVRISNIEGQKIDMETNRKVQLSILNSILGLPQNTDLKVKKELAYNMPDMLPDSLIAYGLKHRDEMKIANEKSTLAQLQYNLTHAVNNPSINIFASGGYKNGYFTPELQPTAYKWNYVAGIGIKVPLFDANRKKNELLISKSNIQECSYEVDITSRNISSEVIQADAEVISSDKKIKQFALQLEQAEKALNLAEINYKAGVITNLDLLDATYAVSESKLMLLNSKIEYISSIFRLKNAIGERLY